MPPTRLRPATLRQVSLSGVMAWTLLLVGLMTAFTVGHIAGSSAARSSIEHAPIADRAHHASPCGDRSPTIEAAPARSGRK